MRRTRSSLLSKIIPTLSTFTVSTSPAPNCSQQVVLCLLACGATMLDYGSEPMLRNLSLEPTSVLCELEHGYSVLWYGTSLITSAVCCVQGIYITVTDLLTGKCKDETSRLCGSTNLCWNKLELQLTMACTMLHRMKQMQLISVCYQWRMLLVAMCCELNIDLDSSTKSPNTRFCGLLKIVTMSGQCAWPGLQLNYFLHNRMGDRFSTSSVEQLRLLITD